MVRDVSENPVGDALIAHLGVWQPQSVLLFGVRVIDTDALSYLS